MGGSPIVIGAGPAGLAVAACLRRAGLTCLLLEQGDAVGTAWRRHYDRLHLHTDKAHSALPFVPFARDCARYPARLQMIEYLEDYARRFELRPRYGQEVRAARRRNGGWEVQTQDGCYQGPQLIVATGLNREPHLPELTGRAGYRGTVLHSCAYRNAAPFRDRSVLVVGFGNSGGEIAIDLCEHGARVSLAVRGPVNVVPRDLFGVSIMTIAIAQRGIPARIADAMNALIVRAAVGDLRSCGLRRRSLGPRTEIELHARVPVIDVGTIELIRRGAITVLPGIDGFDGDQVLFGDGRRTAFDAVILATGYRARVDTFLEAGLAGPRGTPGSSGREAAPGLYFCGYHVTATGMLREIAREAQQIAAAIARQH